MLNSKSMLKPKVVAIVQARMGSTRLPKKVLMKINDHSMLEEVIKRTKAIKGVDEVIVATTENPKDLQIVARCRKLKIRVFRGLEEDVLDRYYQCAKEAGADVIIRITSDCPLLDPTIVEEGLKFFQTTNADYVSNALKRTYPRGLDFEMFTFQALEKAWKEGQEQTDREHVTPYIYSHPAIFKIAHLTNSKDYSEYRLTVDTQIDLELVMTIFKVLGKKRQIFGLNQIVKFLERNPKLAKINSEVVQKDKHLQEEALKKLETISIR